MPRRARIAMASRLSVRLSVTLKYCDHIHVRWTALKTISRLISLGSSLSADSKIVDLLQREHPEF